MYNERHKILPLLPTTTADINNNGVWAQTTIGEPLLLADGDTNWRILIFTTHKNLTLQREQRHKQVSMQSCSAPTTTCQWPGRCMAPCAWRPWRSPHQHPNTSIHRLRHLLLGWKQPTSMEPLPNRRSKNNQPFGRLAQLAEETPTAPTSQHLQLDQATQTRRSNQRHENDTIYSRRKAGSKEEKIQRDWPQTYRT